MTTQKIGNEEGRSISVNPRKPKPDLPPPPQLRAADPASLVQGIQWLIDRVFHLDECLDTTQENLEEATNELKNVVAWQQGRDEADLKEAAARAERRRLFHYGYVFFDFVDKRGWQLVAIGGLVITFLRW